MKSFKVSIILPVYNVEKYLSACLDSLLAQTLEEIEIVAVNDGSTDGSLQILQAYQSLNPEKYKHLVVRVAGYSALFTTLSRSLQDDIIRRTEQGF